MRNPSGGFTLVLSLGLLALLTLTVFVLTRSFRLHSHVHSQLVHERIAKLNARNGLHLAINDLEASFSESLTTAPGDIDYWAESQLNGVLFYNEDTESISAVRSTGTSGSEVPLFSELQANPLHAGKIPLSNGSCAYAITDHTQFVSDLPCYRIPLKQDFEEYLASASHNDALFNYPPELSASPPTLGYLNSFFSRKIGVPVDPQPHTSTTHGAFPLITQFDFQIFPKITGKDLNLEYTLQIQLHNPYPFPLKHYQYRLMLRPNFNPYLGFKSDRNTTAVMLPIGPLVMMADLAIDAHSSVELGFSSGEQLPGGPVKLAVLNGKPNTVLKAYPNHFPYQQHVSSMFLTYPHGISLKTPIIALGLASGSSERFQDIGNIRPQGIPEVEPGKPLSLSISRKKASDHLANPYASRVNALLVQDCWSSKWHSKPISSDLSSHSWLNVSTSLHNLMDLNNASLTPEGHHHNAPVGAEKPGNPDFRFYCSELFDRFSMLPKYVLCPSKNGDDQSPKLIRGPFNVNCTNAEVWEAFLDKNLICASGKEHHNHALAQALAGYAKSCGPFCRISDFIADLSTYIDGEVSQKDFLHQLLHLLATQSHTYIIESYGDSSTSGGEVMAESYARALVQWIPEKTGRSFKVLQFKYL